jgi:hypothetical protein
MSESKILKNGIVLTEVSLDRNQKQEFADVLIVPGDITCIKETVSEKAPSIKASVFLKNFKNICVGFCYEGPILVKETIQEIDDIITEFKSQKKKST